MLAQHVGDVAGARVANEHVETHQRWLAPANGLQRELAHERLARFVQARRTRRVPEPGFSTSTIASSCAGAGFTGNRVEKWNMVRIVKTTLDPLWRS